LYGNARLTWARFTKSYSIYLVLAFMVVLSTVISPNFLTPGNLSNVTRQISVTTILAFGETILIICCMLDLSSGSVLALSASSRCLLQGSGSMTVAIAVAIGVAVFCNLINALMITRFKTAALHRDPRHAGHGARRCPAHHLRAEHLPDGDYVKIGQGSIFSSHAPPHPALFSSR
jgi:inositol transport system permease protein